MNQHVYSWLNNHRFDQAVPKTAAVARFPNITTTRRAIARRRWSAVTMPAIKELTDILGLIQELSEDQQRDAVKSLLHVLERAEKDFSEAHMTERERRELSHEAFLNRMEKMCGKAFTDRTRAYVAYVERFGEPPDWSLGDEPDASDGRPRR